MIVAKEEQKMKHAVHSLFITLLAVAIIISCVACNPQTADTDTVRNVGAISVGTVEVTPADADADAKVVSQTVTTQSTKAEYETKVETVNRFTDVKGATKISDWIRDYDIHYQPGVKGYDKEFILSACCRSPKPPYIAGILWDSTKAYDLGDYYPKGFKYTYVNGEWSSNTMGRLLKAQATSREHAVELIFEWLGNEFSKCTYNETTGIYEGSFVGDSYIRYNHYAAEVGAEHVGIEIGAGIKNAAGGIAYTRGATRQYGLSGWWVEHSDWCNGRYVNYTGDPYAWAETPAGNDELTGRHPGSKRLMHYLEYMSGAAWVRADAQLNFYATKFDESGVRYVLTPHGKVFQEVTEFVERNPDRGIPYAPFGVVMDYYYGLPYALFMEYLIFETFAPNAGDYMTRDINMMFWPDTWPDGDIAEYGGEMVASPYGDTADFLMQNASQEVLDSYPVIILSGAIQFKEGEAERYVKYVENGGVLLLNTAFQSQLDAFSQLPIGEYQYGTKGGRVIVYGPDYDITALPAIMEELMKEFFPFEISGKVEYLLNIKDGSLVLTIINNEGVDKPTLDLAIEDANATQTIDIHYTGTNKVLEVRDWITGELLPASGDQTVTIGPEDLVILEFVL